MFRGKSDHTIDDKGRLNLPLRIRQILRRYDDNIVITTFDDCLYVYPYEEWIKVEEKIYNLSTAQRVIRDFQRLILANAIECTIDKQGRILIPPSLRTWAQIEKDVVIAGRIKHFEIWNKDRFEQVMSQAQTNEADLNAHGVFNDLKL